MRRRALKLAVCLVAVLAAATTAWAYWTTSGTGSAAATVGTLNAATISVPATSTGSIVVTWTQQASLPGSPGQDSGITYKVERKLGVGTYAPVATGPCSGTLAHGTTSCTDTVATSGSYTYRVVASFAGSWTATSNEAGPVVTTIAAGDTTPPTVTSINRVGTTPTNASSVQWTVVFSETVTGVDATDFALAASGVTGASITGVSAGTDTYTVTVGTGTGSGTLGLNLADDDSVKDLALNPLAGAGAGNGNFTGQVYTLDRTSPAVSSIVRAAASPTNASSVSWTVTFGESVTGVDATDFALANTGLGGTPAIDPTVTGSGTTYTVTATTGSGNGTLGLNLADNDSIADGVGNKLGGTGVSNGNFTGEVYTVDRAGPTLSTLQMFDTNTNGKVDQIVATFNETLASSTATAPWTLTNVPSYAAGNRAPTSVTTTGTTATVNFADGPNAANTAVGTFTVTLAASATGIRDSLGNQGSFAATAPADRAGPVPITPIADSGGTNGKFEQNDTMTITFSEVVVGVPASSNVTLTGGVGAAADTVAMTGFLSGTVSLNHAGYITGDGAIATFTGSALSQPTTSQVRITLAACAGACVSLAPGGNGSFTFTPASGLTDAAANPAVGSVTDANSKLF